MASCEAPYFFEEGLEQLFWRIALLLADHAHDRLGLADAHVAPTAGPIYGQAVEPVHAAVATVRAQIHQQGWDALRDQRHLPLQKRIFRKGTKHLAQLGAPFVEHGK